MTTDQKVAGLNPAGVTNISKEDFTKVKSSFFVYAIGGYGVPAVA